MSKIRPYKRLNTNTHKGKIPRRKLYTPPPMADPGKNKPPRSVRDLGLPDPYKIPTRTKSRPGNITEPVPSVSAKPIRGWPSSRGYLEVPPTKFSKMFPGLSKAFKFPAMSRILQAGSAAGAVGAGAVSGGLSVLAIAAGGAYQKALERRRQKKLWDRVADKGLAPNLFSGAQTIQPYYEKSRPKPIKKMFMVPKPPALIKSALARITDASSLPNRSRPFANQCHALKKAPYLKPLGQTPAYSISHELAAKARTASKPSLLNRLRPFANQCHALKEAPYLKPLGQTPAYSFSHELAAKAKTAGMSSLQNRSRPFANQCHALKGAPYLGSPAFTPAHR